MKRLDLLLVFYHKYGAILKILINIALGVVYGRYSVFSRNRLNVDIKRKIITFSGESYVVLCRLTFTFVFYPTKG